MNIVDFVPKRSQLLLVDDDEVDRMSVLRMLKSGDTCEKYDITVAKSYEEALAELNQNCFDVCLIDYHLGGYTGLDLFEIIKQNGRHTSVIILTGMEEKDIDELALKAGIADFLGKSTVNAKILERAIRYAVHRRKMAIEQEYLAHHDPLTELVNRSIFFDRLKHLLSKSHRHQRLHAILYLDLDFFKSINDEYGHDIGDRVLQIFASRVREVVRSIDTFARLGGDEFAIILEEIDSKNAKQVSQKIVKQMTEPFILGELELDVSVSIGITLFPNTELDPKDIIKEADQALYQAKKMGRKRFYQFDKKLKSTVEEEKKLENDLSLGIKSLQLFPEYQPQYSFETGEIVGYEAFARWLHPKEGNIPPHKFIPSAEKLLLMPALTELILTKVVDDLIFLSQARPGVRMAFNISTSECCNIALENLINKLIERSNIHPSQLELDVKESSINKKPEMSHEILTRLHNMGIRIAIDDFGTGHTSLDNLTKLPIDMLKIDMMFVQGIGVNKQKENVVKVILALAKQLGLSVLAEGVENQKQADFLHDLGCDFVQGYFYSKPQIFNQFKLSKV